MMPYVEHNICIPMLMHMISQTDQCYIFSIIQPYNNYGGQAVSYQQQPGISGQIYPQQAVNPNQAVVYPGQSLVMNQQPTPVEGQGIVYAQPPIQGKELQTNFMNFNCYKLRPLRIPQMKKLL